MWTSLPTVMAGVAPSVWGLGAGWSRPIKPRLTGMLPGAARRRAAPGALLHVAVIGCGAAVDRLYRRPLRKLEARGQVRVVALVDPDGGWARGLAGDFPAADLCHTPAEAFRQARVDVALVAAPVARRAGHAIAALDHGSHVLCETPMAASVADAEAMVQGADRNARLLAIGLPRRFYPCAREAGRLLASGGLGGDLRFVYREADAQARGGVLLDIGAHALDLLVALFGAPEVEGYEDDARRGGVETNCRLRLAFPGARGVLQLSRSQPLVSGLHVLGSAGEIKFDLGRIDRLLYRHGSKRWETVVSTASWPADLEAPPRRRGAPRHPHDGATYQLVQVLRAALYGEPATATGAEALLTARAIDACYRRARPVPSVTAA